MNPIGEQLNNYHLPNDSSGDKSSIKQLSIEQVDKLADELETEYGNAGWRGWYCGVIYKYGISRVLEWRRRAQDGKEPAKLFSLYVRQAGGYKREDKNG